MDSCLTAKMIEILQKLHDFGRTDFCRHSNMTLSKKRHNEANFDPNLMIYSSNES